MTKQIAACVVAALAPALSLMAEPQKVQDSAQRLIALHSSVLTKDEAAAAKNMLDIDLRSRMRAAMDKDSAEVAAIKTVADWEKYRDQRLAALKQSIGSGDMPAAAERAKTAPADYEITGKVEGDGFVIENLVIAAREGLPITANLYAPAKPADSMPAILFITAHHNGKWQGELLDLSMTWARSGCAVLVMDALGYGERGQQAYGGREDYRWRYHTSNQLYTAGKNSMGWMVADLRRGVDVLISRPGVDPKRIIVLGSVAGGGDQAAVLAATDQRVTCAILYNYAAAAAVKPLLEGETPWINFIGGGDFDASRCLRNNGRDGFNKWMIASAVAPRYTIIAHEFGWKSDGDEAYARVARVFELYGAADHLATTEGGTDCNNVDTVHRKKFDAMLERWMKINVAEEYRKRLPLDQLTCLTAAARARWQIRPLHQLLSQVGAEQISAARQALAGLPAEKRKEKLRSDWAEKLGNVTPAAAPIIKHSATVTASDYTADKVLLGVEEKISVPVLLLKPNPVVDKVPAKMPVVIAVAREGKDFFIAKRAMEISELLAHNVAVCVVDVRGTGETEAAGERFWYSPITDWASQDMALGQTMVGSRVRDLRSVLMYLRSRPDLDTQRAAVWGDSFAAVNPPRFVDPPMQGDVQAITAEPMGATTALLLALYEDDIKAVVARGGLSGYLSLLDGPASHVTLDEIVPNVLQSGDLADVIATLAPRPVRVEGAVDGRNRLAGNDRLDHDFTIARQAYSSHADALRLSPIAGDDIANWLSDALK